MFALTPAVIGLLSSAVVELLKLIPFLRQSSLYSALTTIVVMIVGTYAFAGPDLSLATFGQVVIWSLVSYKLLIQPSAIALGSSSQRQGF